jgi:beta-N-acetylhexosaminidase
MIERCLMPGFVGTEPPDWVLRHVADGLGSVCLYGRNVKSPEQLARLCAALHAENPQLVIAIDEEGGDVTRLEAATGSSYPGNLALGAVGDIDLTRSVARAIGLELARAGVDLDLAPVADVNSNPSNPVIGVRSFGSDPAAAARQTAAWVEGLQSAGVGACVKHFPGHGDTSVDSHLALPTVAEDPHTGALQPFHAGIAAGARAVMSAHIVVPTLDGVPATISSAVMTGLLRGELGFKGLAVSDGIEMRAISDGVGIVEGGVRALAAGCDLLCIGGGLAGEDVVVQLHDAIAGAVRTGRLSEERLAQAASRVTAFATWRAMQHTPEAPADREVGLRAARLAVRSEGAVRVGDAVLVVKLLAGRSIAAGAIPWGVEGPLAERGLTVSVHELAEPPSGLDDLILEADGRSLVLTVRDLHRHPWEAALAETLIARRPDTVVVEMGVPACRPAGASAFIATMGAARVCGVAAAEVMRP